MMGNKATTGPFAPLVVVVRDVVGEKDFNKLRGKAISLHSQGVSSSLMLLLINQYIYRPCSAAKNEPFFLRVVDAMSFTRSLPPMFGQQMNRPHGGARE